MSSSSLMTSHGVALATAVAVSGTVIVLALCRQKPPFSIPAAAAALGDPNPAASWCRPLPRPCISSAAEKKLQNRKQKKKRVQFAAEVVEFACNEEESPAAAAEQGGEERQKEERRTSRRMPANRVALYNGILRDRVMQRTTHSY